MPRVIVIEPDPALRTSLWERLAALGAQAQVVDHADEVRALLATAPARLCIARGDGDVSTVRRLAEALTGRKLGHLVVLECGASVPKGRAIALYLHEVDRVIAAALFHPGPALPEDLAAGQTPVECPLASERVDAVYAELGAGHAGILRHETDGERSRLSAPWLGAVATRRAASGTSRSRDHPR